MSKPHTRVCNHGVTTTCPVCASVILSEREETFEMPDSKQHSEAFIVIDTARFLAEHPENAGVSDAVKLARAYVGLYEQLEAEQRENQSAHARIAELDERLEASQNALRGLVAAIEGAHLMEFENGYGPFETALHEADRVLSNPASEPKEDA